MCSMYSMFRKTTQHISTPTQQLNNLSLNGTIIIMQEFGHMKPHDPNDTVGRCNHRPEKKIAGPSQAIDLKAQIENPDFLD